MNVIINIGILNFSPAGIDTLLVHVVMILPRGLELLNCNDRSYYYQISLPKKQPKPTDR